MGNKFKVGDFVVRTAGDWGIALDDEVYQVSELWAVGAGIKLKGDTERIYDPANFRLAHDKELTPADGVSWDYAEAQRLQDVAKQAVKEYNDYVDRKPETVFLKLADY